VNLSPSPGSARRGKVFFFLVLIVCLLQAKKAIDFRGYWQAVRASVESGFHRIPYPVGDTAVAGDYFQSPVTTFLLVPWSTVPEPAAKVLWALTNLLLLAWLIRTLIREPLGLTQVVFFMLIFAHGISDVFLSGNINFPMLALLVAGWKLMDRPSAFARAAGAACLAVAVYIKVVPLFFLGFFVVTAQWKKVGYLVGALVTLPLLTWLALPSGTFLPWWQGWLQALDLYGAAAGPERLSYQSPPAAIFRLLDLLTDLPRAGLLSVMNGTALAITGGLFVLAVWLWRRGPAHQGVFPVLLSAFFLGGPYSWALTTLFCFPLVFLATRDGISRLSWAAAVGLALTLKEIWPEPLWNVIATWSLPAICLAVLLGDALWQTRQSALESWSPSPQVSTRSLGSTT
jgi:hypothetical protein